MKLRFTIPYRANWGEALYLHLVYMSADGQRHAHDMMMTTADGYLWTLETKGQQSRLHPYTGLAYYYEVRDGEGKLLRRESVASPRVYPYSEGHNFYFNDLWLVDKDETDLYHPAPIKDADFTKATPPDLPLYEKTVFFKVAAPRLRRGEALAVVGNHPTLGDWNTERYLRMNPSGATDWTLSVNVMALSAPLEYKYIVVDAETQKFKRWEEGVNRTMGPEPVYAQDVYVLHGDEFRLKKLPPHAQFNFDTYVFDLDGTLLSTLSDLAASCNHALRLNALPERTLDEVRRFVGNGVRLLMERAVPDGAGNKKFEKTLADFRQHYMEHSLDTTSPYPDILETLAELKARGKRVAVVSNKFYDATVALCRHFFGPLVDVAIGEREGIRKKPAPDTVLEALRQLETTAERAVYIGDSDVDIETARACGMPCISVLWGFRDRDFLMDHGATIFVSSPLQIV